MPWDGTVKVYSNDGNTQLASFSSGSGIIDVNSSGIYRPSSKFDDPLQVYTYSGTKTFLGVSTTTNTSTPDVPVGTTGYDVVPIAVSFVANLYIVDADPPVTYEHLTYGSNKIQVDSAIRDGNGKQISTNYAKKSEVPNITTSSSAPSGGSNGDIWIQY